MKLHQLTLAVAVVSALLASCGGSVDARIGGTLSGLAGSTTVSLVNNGGDLLTLNSNGNFNFRQKLSSKSSYNVTVYTQPNGETCSVTNGSGNVDSRGSDVSNITVSCVAGSSTTTAVSAAISGLAFGADLVLLNNGVDNLTVTGTTVTASGGTVTKLFSTPLVSGANYSVTVSTQPVGQACVVTNGIGQIPATGSAAPAIVTCQ